MPMIDRIDHVVIAVRDLDAAISYCRDRLGLDVRPGGRHTGRGTHNGIVRFGLDYVELIAIYDRAEAEASRLGGPELGAFLDDHDGGPVGFCLATGDPVRLAKRLEQAVLGPAEPFAMERARPDGNVLRWQMVIPKGTAWRRPWPFFIRWENPDSERLAWDGVGQHRIGATGPRGVSVAVADLDAARDLFGQTLDLRRVGVVGSKPLLGAARAVYRIGGFTIELLAPTGPGTIRDEIDSRGEGVFELQLGVRDLEQAGNTLHDGGVNARVAPDGIGLLVENTGPLGTRILLVSGRG